jgi:hypothetical protein
MTTMHNHNHIDSILMVFIWILQAIIAFTKNFMDIDFEFAYEILFKLTQITVLVISGMASYRLYKKNK